MSYCRINNVKKEVLIYSYYWSTRTCGECSCLDDEPSIVSEGSARDVAPEEAERTCDAAREARELAQRVSSASLLFNPC